MGSMFRGADKFNHPIGNWNTGAVISMQNMFSNTSAFNQPIGSWNTSAVADMDRMFFYATAFNQPLENWNTSQVKNMIQMFAYDSVFNQPISNWNTSNVDNMKGMFANAISFNQPISNWKTSNVRDMSNMFYSAKAFNQSIGKWDVTQVESMSNMLYLAKNFNQRLDSLSLNRSVFMNYMLDSSGISCENYSSTLKGWAGNHTTPTGLIFGAAGISYGIDADTARNLLTTTVINGGKGWTITGDNASSKTCAFVTNLDDRKNGGSMELYPNPVLEILYLSKIVPYYSLLNANGVQVLSGKYVDRIDMSSLSTGIYIFKSENFFAKVVK
jgi:surface protein